MTKVNILFTKRTSFQLNPINFIPKYLDYFRFLLPTHHQLPICLDINQVKHENTVYCYLDDYHLAHFQYNQDADLILGLNLIKNIGNLLIKSGQFSLITYYQNEATVKTTIQLDGDIIHQIGSKYLFNPDDSDKLTKILHIHHFVFSQILHSFRFGGERLLLIFLRYFQIIGWIVSFSLSLKTNPPTKSCILGINPTCCFLLQPVIRLVFFSVIWWVIGYILQQWLIPYLSRCLWKQIINPDSLLSQWL